MLGNFLAKILIHYKTDLKHGVTMPLHQRYYLTCIYSCIKFYCPSLRGSWLLVAKKSPIWLDKNVVLFGKYL